MPEAPNNIDMTFGNLGLTDHEEDQLVTFMQTLTDGFTTPYPYQDAIPASAKWVVRHRPRATIPSFPRRRFRSVP